MRNDSTFLTAICGSILIFLFAFPAHSMEFEHVGNGGNCTGCEWVRASGLVEPGDAERFEAILNQENYGVKPHISHNVIMFDSPGGSLSAGIKLGKKIRELGFAVGVGKSDPTPDSVFFEQSSGNCISACAYAFLGGRYRYLDDDKSCLGFHQFFDNAAARKQGSDALASVQETTQIISGIVVQYLTEIEAPLEIYTFASKYTGTEYGCLNKDEDLKLLVDNTTLRYTKASLLPFGRGLVTEINSPQDDRTLRFYCMNNGKFLLAYFLPGDVKIDYDGLLAGDGNLSGLKFSAGEHLMTPRLELVQLISKGKKTAIVFQINHTLVKKAFETGGLDTGMSDSGRAQQSWFNEFNFSIKGNSKIPNLIASNCIG